MKPFYDKGEIAVGDFRKEFQEEVRRRFSSHIENNPEYVVQQMYRDGDVVKLWRCGKPGSSICSFYICSSVGCLMVYGDMGEYMWERHPDMIPFIRGSIHSLAYFSEKVPHGIEIKEDCSELIEEWFSEIKQDWVEYGSEWGEKEENALEELRDSWDSWEDVGRFMQDFFDSIFYNDCESFPNCRYYTFQYLWVIEGLKWFIQQLDGGHVIAYVEPATLTD